MIFSSIIVIWKEIDAIFFWGHRQILSSLRAGCGKIIGA
jgi:hypothetical protein